jgi:hypothetical protein
LKGNVTEKDERQRWQSVTFRCDAILFSFYFVFVVFSLHRPARKKVSRRKSKTPSTTQSIPSMAPHKSSSTTVSSTTNNSNSNTMSDFQSEASDLLPSISPNVVGESSRTVKQQPKRKK